VNFQRSILSLEDIRLVDETPSWTFSAVGELGLADETSSEEQGLIPRAG
jgi:hypothetical protein